MPPDPTNNPNDPPFGFLPSEPPTPAEGERLTEWKGYQLLPFQIQAVQAVRQGHNVLVAAPTGSGKTLVAEYAIEDAARRDKRCIYTSPIKALSNQKYRDFRDDPQVDVGLMTGDVTIHPQARVLIMTTEILRNAIFENPSLLDDVGFVVFDEIHFMDDRERGTVWEESLIFLPSSVRLICLSATVSNVEELGSWLSEIRTQPMEVVRESRRPVPLAYYCWTERNGTFIPGKLKEIRNRTRSAQAASGSQRGSRRAGRGRRGRRGGGGFSGPPDPTSLFDDLIAEDKLPALVFSFSRKDCERLARRNEHRQLLSPEEAQAMEALQLELVQLFQMPERTLRGEIFALARGGVGYHHAGMLPVFKEMVERMFTAGLLKLLFTTETFALGINMPARSVVFNALRKFDGVSFDYLRTRDFLQMAGRAGRQGIDDKGQVYCVLGDRDLLEAPLERLFAGKPEPVTSRFNLSYSSILHLVERVGRDYLHEAWERSFHCYQGREGNQKARTRQRRDQRRSIDRYLALLDELEYLDGDSLTPRGRVARTLNGYELQMSELLFRGTLENLNPQALATVLVGLVYEERRRHDPPRVPERMYGALRRSVSGVVREINGLEARLGIDPPVKRPDWGLTPAVQRWYEGADLEELEELGGAASGDICRVFRMSVQLMRNVRRAVGPDSDLSDLLQEAVTALNRDEIDARKQLELG